MTKGRHYLVLSIEPFLVVAHYKGHPMALVSLQAPRPAHPITIGDHPGADLDVGLGRARVSVFGDDRVLFAEVTSPGAGVTTYRLDYGQRLEFGDTVLHFFPDEQLPASLYRPSGTDCDELLSLPEFQAEVARLVAALTTET